MDKIELTRAEAIEILRALENHTDEGIRENIRQLCAEALRSALEK